MATPQRNPKPLLIDPDTLTLVQTWIDNRTGPWTIPEAIALLIRRGIDAPAAQPLPPVAVPRHHPVKVNSRFA